MLSYLALRQLDSCSSCLLHVQNNKIDLSSMSVFRLCNCVSLNVRVFALFNAMHHGTVYKTARLSVSHICQVLYVKYLEVLTSNQLIE